MNEFRDQNGCVRPLGRVVTPRRGWRMKSFGKVGSKIPRSEWREFYIDDNQWPVKIKDQDGKGACNGHAAATALEMARWFAGEPHYDLSAWFIYAILCNGVDRGSIISDALELCRDQGTCLDASVAYGTINPRKLTAKNKTEAGRFKIEIGSMLRTFDECMTAVQLRRPINFSVNVGNNFDRFRDGFVCGVTPGPGNHAIAAGRGAIKTKNNEWAIPFSNSWTTQWGDKGVGWVVEEHFERQSYFEAYEILATLDDPDSEDPPSP